MVSKNPNLVFDTGLKARCDMLRERYGYRDSEVTLVTQVRHGDWDLIDPDAFSDAYPRPIVANRIDVQARHAAAALSPMPSIRCRASSQGASQAAKDRADIRTKIVNHYFERSKVASQMQTGADQFASLGLIVAQIVPNFEDQMPDILIRDSRNFYPVWDAKGNTVEAAHIFNMRVVDLVAQYPEAATVLNSELIGRNAGQSRLVEVTHHDDGEYISLFVGECNGLVLKRIPNPIGRCLFICTARVTGEPGYIRGMFADMPWAQLAMNEMQMLTLEATAKSVQAPVAVPPDVTDMPTGSDAIIRTQAPRDVHRVSLEVPRETFMAISHFTDELRQGTITPEAMGGSIDASVVTGKGVQELMAGYSQQIAMMQGTLTEFFIQVAYLCFKVDETLWPNVSKSVDGVRDGNEYSITYTPSKDINGNCTADVTYGTSTGLDPNRHLVWLLQLVSAGLFSRDTALRELPYTINPQDEVSKIQVEQGRDALMGAISGLAESIGAIASNGGDPSAVVSQIAEFVDQLEKGKPIEEIAKKVWAPPPAPEPGAEQAAGPEDPLAALMGGGAPPGMPGMPGAAPEGKPDLATMFAGMTQGGQPNLSGTVMRNEPAM